MQTTCHLHERGPTKKNHRSRGLALILLDAVRRIGHSIDRTHTERSKVCSCLTRLVSTLQVKAQMPAIVQEADTCRIEVSSVHVDGGIACRVTQEGSSSDSYSLKNRHLSRRCNAHQEGSRVDEFSHLSYLLVKTAAKVQFNCT